MAKQDQSSTKRDCGHYLGLVIRSGRDGLNLWASCKLCKRRWFVGTEAEVLDRFDVSAGRAS